VVDLVLVAGKLEDYCGQQAEQGLALGGREPGRGAVQYAPAASSGLARQALATLSTGEGDGAPVPGWGAGHQAAALEPIGRPHCRAVAQSQGPGEPADRDPGLGHHEVERGRVSGFHAIGRPDGRADRQRRRADEIVGRLGCPHRPLP